MPRKSRRRQRLKEEAEIYLKSAYGDSDSENFYSKLPYISADIETLTLRQFSIQLKQALLSAHYYHESSKGSPKKRGPTLYERLKEKRLTSAIFSPRDLRPIQHWSNLFRLFRREEILRNKGQSRPGYRTAFHDAMLEHLLDTANTIQQLTQDHKVEGSWTLGLVKTLGSHIAKEFVASFPEALDIEVVSSTSARIEVYEAVFGALRDAGGHDIEELSAQIAAVVCSLPEYAQTKRLTVSPKNFKDAVRDEKRAAEKRNKKH